MESLLDGSEVSALRGEYVLEIRHAAQCSVNNTALYTANALGG